jgi:N-acyl-D-aspartate/D-glutamate deacylase
MTLDEKLGVLRDPARRQELIDDAANGPDEEKLERFFVITGEIGARYDCKPETSLPAIARQRGVSMGEAFIDLAIETDGKVIVNWPLLNQDLDVVSQMISDPRVVMGLADSGAHVGQILDASQPTFFLSYWVREKGLMPVEEAIRRLTSDTAELFGIADRGVLRPGAKADINIIDWDSLHLPLPTFEHDFPGGAGRYVQRAKGYDATIVNGQVFLRDGEHTGAYPGEVLRG